MTYSILVVDDEKDIVDSLERQFRKEYKVLKATSGIEALRILQNENVQLILSDQRMPEMTGVQLFERAQKIQPDAIRILLTGYTDVASVIAAINNGQIYRYITKPWDPTDLDITVKKALEAFELRHELKEKNAKLQAALEELKSLDQAKSHFMILIGHELKTPLTTISSFVDLLREERLSAEAEKYTNRISQGTERLQDIVFDVLDLLGAETGQLPLHKGKHKISDVVARVTDDLKSTAEKKSINIKSEGVNISAYYDPTILGKALKKIIHNAIKFANSDTEVLVGAEETSGKVEIYVENSGPPIAEQKIAQILKPFTLDEDIMHHSQGMGLGLSVCQSLLKHHGSTLSISSGVKKTRVGFKISETK